MNKDGWCAFSQMYWEFYLVFVTFYSFWPFIYWVTCMYKAINTYSCHTLTQWHLKGSLDALIITHLIVWFRYGTFPIKSTVHLTHDKMHANIYTSSEDTVTVIPPPQIGYIGMSCCGNNDVGRFMESTCCVICMLILAVSQLTSWINTCHYTYCFKKVSILINIHNMNGCLTQRCIPQKYFLNSHYRGIKTFYKK